MRPSATGPASPRPTSSSVAERAAQAGPGHRTRSRRLPRLAAVRRRRPGAVPVPGPHPGGRHPGQRPARHPLRTAHGTRPGSPQTSPPWKERRNVETPAGSDHDRHGVRALRHRPFTRRVLALRPLPGPAGRPCSGIGAPHTWVRWPPSQTRGPRTAGPSSEADWSNRDRKGRSRTQPPRLPSRSGWPRPAGGFPNSLLQHLASGHLPGTSSVADVGQSGITISGGSND